MADVTQFIIGQMPFQFMIQWFAILGIDGKLAQIAYMSTDAASADAAVGNYQGRFYSQVFSNVDKQEYDPAESTFGVSINKTTLHGDLNEDGKVDVADVTELVNIILGNSDM